MPSQRVLAMGLADLIGLVGLLGPPPSLASAAGGQHQIPLHEACPNYASYAASPQ